MLVLKREVLIYQTRDGRAPYEEWLSSLKDRTVVAKVRVRIDRLRLGNVGDCRFVGRGVYELKIDYGPGYRLYLAQEGKRVVLLLCGGDKRTQQKAIKNAQQYWADYRRREP